MMETSTSINKSDYEQSEKQEMLATELDTRDRAFYESIKAQLDGLKKSPSEDTISRILAYSKAK
ncbi:hypothetical protein [Pedobacter sp. JY14-1]|uniref:hypothetical protein n=1 Tax=Pedobacter sp. JY14-1 TaxID=3034151 RepID=UPI0023E2AA57|nr:hypothetical protein [Pedobacter sp. JY14-1]